MGDQLCLLFFSLLIIHTTLQGIQAVSYNVVNNAPNTPGGIRFNREIGIPYTRRIMKTINLFIWSLLEEYTPADRKDVPTVTIYISDFTGPLAYVNGPNINVSAKYLELSKYNVRWDFTSVMYHEMTHVFQWSGNYTAPGGLTEGVAQYVMISSNFYDKRLSGKPGWGKRWDEGYDITARFLMYCDTLRPGFTAALNKKMRYAWSEHYFVELLGKPVDQLWREYKAKYHNPPATSASSQLHYTETKY